MVKKKTPARKPKPKSKPKSRRTRTIRGDVSITEERWTDQDLKMGSPSEVQEIGMRKFQCEDAAVCVRKAVDFLRSEGVKGKTPFFMSTPVRRGDAFYVRRYYVSSAREVVDRIRVEKNGEKS